jgi:hypothetical protein
MPVNRADYPKFPLTSGAKPVYSPRIQSFHLAVAHLRCFNAQLNKPGEINFNWWDRDTCFIKGARKVPPYTDLFWTMFFKLAPFLGGMKKEILEAETAADIDALRQHKVRVPVPDQFNEGTFITAEIPLLSPEVRAMIDNMLYVSCYGHKAMFEDRVPPASIIAFRTCALKIACDKESEFFNSWKDYRKRHPIAKKPAEVDNDVTDLVNDLMGDDEPALDAAEAPAAAPAEGASVDNAADNSE